MERERENERGACAWLLVSSQKGTNLNAFISPNILIMVITGICSKYCLQSSPLHILITLPCSGELIKT